MSHEIERYRHVFTRDRFKLRPRIPEQRRRVFMNVSQEEVEQAPEKAPSVMQMDEAEDLEENNVLKGPYPGGPENPSLLPSFKTHVAAMIWKGEERELLKVHCHTNKLLEWTFTTDQTTQNWRDLIRDTGMLALRDFAYPSPNRALIGAFIERWQPETNTFHMPFGEMTITLDDVRCLTGLKIEGQPVEFQRDANMEDGTALVSRLLGVSQEVAADQLSAVRGSSFKLSWLIDEWKNEITSNDPHTLDCAARAYIMYSIGCVLFADKSGARVGTHFLRILDDVEDAGQYAWGTAALAYLYRQLGIASRHGVKQLAGFIPLLEAWIYEHFPFTRPAHNLGFNPQLPLARKWVPPPRYGGSFQDQISMRERLDALTVSDVEWNPYAKVREYHPLEEIVFFHGCIRSFDIAEPYHPDRVLRQFGFVQTIPAAPLGPTFASRPAKGGKYKLVWADGLAGYYRTWDNHVLSTRRRGRVAILPWECANDYLSWFNEHSHPIVQCPNRASWNAAHHTTNSASSSIWDQHQAAIALMEQPVHLWRLRDNSLTLENVMTQIDQAYIALGGMGWDDAPNPNGVVPDRPELSRNFGRGRRRPRR